MLRRSLLRLRASAAFCPCFSTIVLQLNIGARIRVAHPAICRPCAQLVLNLAPQRIASSRVVAIVARTRVSEAVFADEPRSKVANEKPQCWKRAANDDEIRLDAYPYRWNGDCPWLIGCVQRWNQEHKPNNTCNASPARKSEKSSTWLKPTYKDPITKMNTRPNF